MKYMERLRKDKGGFYAALDGRRKYLCSIGMLMATQQKQHVRQYLRVSSAVYDMVATAL
jgi:hypothetical protein